MLELGQPKDLEFLQRIAAEIPLLSFLSGTGMFNFLIESKSIFNSFGESNESELTV